MSPDVVTVYCTKLALYGDGMMVLLLLLALIDRVPVMLMLLWGPLALMMMLALLTAGQLVLMMAAIAWLVFYSAAFLPCQSQSRLNLFVYLVLLFL